MRRRSGRGELLVGYGGRVDSRLLFWCGSGEEGEEEEGGSGAVEVVVGWSVGSRYCSQPCGGCWGITCCGISSWPNLWQSEKLVGYWECC